MGANPLEEEEPIPMCEDYYAFEVNNFEVLICLNCIAARSPWGKNKGTLFEILCEGKMVLV